MINLIYDIIINMNNNIIDNIYNQNNFPSLGQLYKLVKSDHPKITRNEVKEFLDDNIGEQLLKTTKKSRKKQGHISANYENELWNIDIFDLSKFGKFNSNYLYILCSIDVFSRKVYCQPMKNKDVPECIKAFENMISTNNIPAIIFSDQDATFLSKSFSSMLDRRKKIAFNVNTLNDHHSLGIIDSFAKRLKLNISKTMLRNNNKIWVTHLQAIISKYNNQKLPALDNIKPNQVTEPKNNQVVYDLNITKAKKTNMKSDFVINDRVRLKITKKFTKSSDIQLSDQIYKVIEIFGGHITLDNNQTVKRSSLLKVTGLNTIQTGQNVKVQANKSSKIDKVLKSDGIDQTNILTVRRRRK